MLKVALKNASKIICFDEEKTNDLKQKHNRNKDTHDMIQTLCVDRYIDKYEKRKGRFCLRETKHKFTSRGTQRYPGVK